MMNKFIENNKKTILIVIGIIVVLIIALSGNELYTYIKKEQTNLKNDITDLENANKSLKDSVVYYKDKITILDVKEDNYYNDYVREYNKRLRAEKKLLDIRHLVYDRKYLDSLKNNIEYR